MITYLITHSGQAVKDNPTAREAEFSFLARYTGDEWTKWEREAFAPRYVMEEDDGQWSVAWDCGDETNIVSSFADRALAEKFAAEENDRLRDDYMRQQNVVTLDLPHGWDVYIGSLMQGHPWPLSSQIPISLTDCNGITAKGYAYWDARGISDTWLDRRAIKAALIDLIQAVVDAAAKVE
jgi:hypothetical protein